MDLKSGFFMVMIWTTIIVSLTAQTDELHNSKIAGHHHLRNVDFNDGSQGLPKNSLSLTIGTGHLSRQDLIFSTLVYRDFSPVQLGIVYQRNTQFYQSLMLNYASYTPSIKPSYSFIDHEELHQTESQYFSFIDLKYGLGKYIQQGPQTGMRIGFMASADVQTMTYTYGRVGSNFGYFSNFGAGVFVEKYVFLNKKSRVNAYFSAPLISWAARSPYLVNDDEFIENIYSHTGFKTFLAFVGDGQLSSLNHVQMMDLGLEYRLQINQKWAVSAAYYFDFIHDRSPRSLLSYNNSFGLNIILNW